MTDVSITAPLLDVRFDLFLPSVSVVVDPGVVPPETARAPFTGRLQRNHDPVSAHASRLTTIGEAPFDGQVTSVTFIASSSVVGENTNTRTLRLINSGQSGTSQVVVAELQFLDGVDAVAFDEVAIPLSDTQVNRVVAKGDILVLRSAHAGSGLADPGGLVQVEFVRD